MLLKRFAIASFDEIENANASSVYCLDKSNNAIKRKGIENCAYENYYYSFINEDGNYNPKLEMAFSHLEDNAARILSKIDYNVDLFKRTKEVREISSIDKNTIIFFLFLSLVRVPSIYGNMINEIKKHETRMAKKYGDQISNERIKYNSVKLLSEFTNPSKSPVYAALLKKQMSVIYCRKSQRQFVIGDSSVFFHNDIGPDGLAYKETEVYFPISKTTCIILQDNLPNLPYLHIDQLDFIDQINANTHKKAIRYIYSDNMKVLESIIKYNEKVNSTTNCKV